MSTTSKIEAAVDVAEQFMAKNEYRYGPCIGVSLKSDLGSDDWEVEFAYEGLEERSPTSDPPAIVLIVNINTEEARTVELM